MAEHQVLSVTYDIALLTSRQAVLESAGHSVQSASDLQDALELLRHRIFHVTVVGQDLPEHHQHAIMAEARRISSRILLLTLNPADTHLQADRNLDPYDGPYALLENVEALLNAPIAKRPAKAAGATASPGEQGKNLA
jgi:DNA-binding NtrC family response regulator